MWLARSGGHPPDLSSGLTRPLPGTFGPSAAPASSLAFLSSSGFPQTRKARSRSWPLQRQLLLGPPFSRSPCPNVTSSETCSGLNSLWLWPLCL